MTPETGPIGAIFDIVTIAAIFPIGALLMPARRRRRPRRRNRRIEL